MPSRARVRSLAAVILARDEAAARWDAVPQHRKDNLDKFLEAHRAHPIGLVFK